MSDANTIKNDFATTANMIVSLSHRVNFTDINKMSQALAERINNQTYRITVIGEFNRGKSTLVNALLGATIVPTAARETTATLNVIHYAEAPSITVIEPSGIRREITPTADAFKEYTALKDFDPTTVDHVEVGFPAQFLQQDIVLIDTPGVNDINQQRLDITYRIMPQSDATILLLDAGKPFTSSESIFLKDHVLKNNIQTIFFLVNKIDLIDKNEIASVVRDIKKKIKFELNIDQPRVIPMSSAQALKGVLEGNAELLEASHMVSFQSTLVEFVTGSERTGSSLKMMQLNLLGLISAFDAAIDNEETLSKASIKELEAQKQRLGESVSALKSRFDEIMRYVDTDKEALSARIEMTLNDRFKEVFDELRLEIEIQKSDLTDYAEKILPHKLKMAFKQWFERNTDSIEEYLAFTSRNSITAFERDFSRKPLFEYLRSEEHIERLLRPSTFAVEGKESIDTTGKLAMAGGAILAAGITAIATGGLSLAVVLPSLIGGSFLSGTFVKPYMTSKVVQDQKVILLADLSTAMKTQYESLRRGLLEHCDKYYSALKDSLNREFESNLAMVGQEIDSKLRDLSNDRAEIEKRNATLATIQTELHQLGSRVKSVDLSTMAG